MLKIAKVSPTRGGLRLQLVGITTCEQAEALVGSIVRTERKDLPALSDGEYYDTDVPGTRVLTPAGEEIGVVTEVLHTGANDIFVAKGPSGEVLIPVTGEAVLEMNIPDFLVVEPEILVFSQDDAKKDAKGEAPGERRTGSAKSGKRSKGATSEEEAAEENSADEADSTRGVSKD